MRTSARGLLALSLSVVLGCGLAACGGDAGGGSGGGTADAPGVADGGTGVDGTPGADASACAATHTIFVNRNGGTFLAGAEDPATNSSTLISSTRTLPAYGDGDTFDGALACLRALFAAYDVQLVTTEPESGDYLELVIGGTPEQAGLPSSVLGVSPTRCEPHARAIGFVFPGALDAVDAQMLCELGGFQLGAMYGLEIELLPRDVMSYILADMPKRFLDEAASCGISEPEACQCGGPTQNSHQELLATLGPARACP